MLTTQIEERAKNSTNVRHTVIARATKDSTPLLASFVNVCRLLKETQKTQPLSLASFSAVGSLALGGAEDPNALARKE